MKSIRLALALLCLGLLAACGSDASDGVAAPVCGNGVLEAGEACDDGNTDDTDACLSTCEEATCGDGHVRAGFEACDDGNDVDDDDCTNECRLATCGDAIVQEGELCDDGNDVETDECTSLCLPARCGDGHVQGDEQCDEGEENADTGTCTTQCRLPACGDGFVQGDEQCDDGENNADDAACTSDCKNAFCGDGLVQPGEECDLGAENADTGACTTACRNPSCGDGFIQADEECDEGNENAETGACLPTCKANTCGDGFHDQSEGSQEECDLGAGNGDGRDDLCTASCTLPVCGDSILQGDEVCDDGNDVDTDGCPTNCRPAVCGDGFVQEGVEGCDLGEDVNSNEPDAPCRENCQPKRCGDGVQDTGEHCDDGNNDAGDGCSPTCLIEGDSCAAPLVIPSSPTAFSLSGDTSFWGSDIDLDFCTTRTAVNRDVVYTFTSPIAARWTFELTPAGDFDAVLGVLGSCLAIPAAGDELACADGPAEGGVETVTVDLAVGQTVFLVVDGFDDDDLLPDEGAYTLTGAATPIAPEGASCVDALCEPHLVCNPTSQLCAQNVCGDGFVRGGESCDDGNTTAGDGCDASCQMEGDICANAGTLPLLADGTVRFAGTTHLAAANYESGCAVNGASRQSGDVVFAFTAPEDARWTFRLDAAFDGILAVQAACGDKATNLACDNTLGTAGIDTVSVTLGGGETVYLLVDGFDSAQIKTGAFELTGSSVPVVPAGAACSATVPCAPGSHCYLLDGVCLNTCGDGDLDAISRESCDDGNVVGGDGCSANCVKEPDWACPVAGAPCRPIVCGDGNVDAPEACDDGNMLPGDGCSDLCQFEAFALPDTGSDLVIEGRFTVDDPLWFSPGSQCNFETFSQRRYQSFAVVNDGPVAKTVNIEMSDLAVYSYLHVYAEPWNPALPQSNCLSAAWDHPPVIPSITVQPGERRLILVTDYGETLRPYTLRVSNPGVCGDGIWGNAEECDDGNNIVGDGCDNCAVEFGWTCNHATASCTANDCGDGVVGVGEECDDGNLDDGDTCSALCTLRGDTCADAAAIAVAAGSTSFSVSGETTGASADYNLLCGNYLNTTAHPDRVYSFTAPASGVWHFAAMSDTYNYGIVLGVQRVCGDTGRTLACDGDTTVKPVRSASLEMMAGETVFLIVDGYTSTMSSAVGAGGFTLTGTLYPYKGAGESCDPAEQRDRCADGFLCDTAAASPVCIPTTCGNGVIERGEECEGTGAGCIDCKVAATPLADAGSSVTFTGRLDPTDPTWLPPSNSCTPTTRNGNWHYDVHYVRNTGTSTAVVDIDLSRFVSAGMIYVYDLPFDPAQPLVGCEDSHFFSVLDSKLENFEIRAGEAKAIVVVNGLETDPAPGAYTLRVITEPVCGDGIWGDAEACDDGGNLDGDGCSATCQVEPNWTCVRGHGPCFISTCGDGFVGNGEACDDGNGNETDSCRFDCTWNGRTCADAVVLAPTAADPRITVQGDTRGMGADYDVGCTNSGLNPDVFYQFTAPVHGFWTFEVRGRFDTAIAVTSTCGDTSTELACTELGSAGQPDRATVELRANDTVYVVVDGWSGNNNTTVHEGSFALDVQVRPIKQLTESCDPAGIVDACAAGTLCDPDTSTCVGSICGNGQLESGEECDDGNLADGDACTSDCLLPATPLAGPGSALRFEDALAVTDDKWFPPSTSCTATTRNGDWYYDAWVVRNTDTVERTIDVLVSKMTLTTFVFVYDLPWDPTQPVANCLRGGATLTPTIRDVVLQPGEAKMVVVSTGATSNPATGPYLLTIATHGACGDGIWGDNEACDGGVGCTASCTPEPGFSCIHPTGCALNVCGDGVIGDAEECDDGNTINDDACSNICVANGASCGDVATIRTTASDPSFTVVSTTVGGGADYTLSCANTGPSADRVYAFTAPVGGSWTFGVRGHGFDSALAVTRACGIASSELGCSEVGLLDAMDHVDLELAAGETVYLEVDGFNGAAGPFTLTGRVKPWRQLGETCDPTGDAGFCTFGAACDGTAATPTCVAAVCGNGILESGEACDDGGRLDGDGCSADCAIEGSSCDLPRVIAVAADNTFTVNGDTTGLPARYAIGCAATDRSPEMHFQFTAPVAGEWRFTVNPTGFDSALAVTRTCGDGAGQIACVETGGSGAADTVDVRLQQNETVFIVVDGFSSSTSIHQGPFVLSGSLVVPQRQLGGGCDPAGVADFCAAGSQCHQVNAVCVATTCGNGILEPGEACDDGDQIDGNACSNDCQVRGDSCAAPFDLRAKDTDASPGRLLVTGDLLGYQHDQTPSCNASMADTAARRDVVYELKGNGVADEHWKLTLTTPGTTATNGVVLDLASACVPRNARIDCIADARSNLPGTVEFVLGAHETVYVWVDERTAHTTAKAYTLSAEITQLLPAGSSCDPASATTQCARDLTCDGSGTCTAASCGNYVVEAEEECDHGPMGSSECSTDCYRIGDSCNAPFDLNVVSTSNASGAWVHAGDLAGMTPSYIPYCTTAGASNDVVYVFTAPVAGTYTFTETQSFDAALYASHTCPDTSGSPDLVCTANEFVSIRLDAQEQIFFFLDRAGTTVGLPTTGTSWVLEVVWAP